MDQIIRLYRNAFSGLSRDTWWQAGILLINRSGTMVVPFMAVYFTQALGYSVTQAGWVVAFFGIGAIFGAYFGGKLTDKIGFFPVQFWSLLLSGLLFFVLGILKVYWQVALCTFLLSLVGEAFRPANAAATAHFSTPENRTRSYSLNRLAINLGFAIGPAVGGLLASINYSLLFVADGATCIASAIVLRMVLPPVKIRATHVPAPGNLPVTPLPASLLAYKDIPYLIFTALVVLSAFCFFQLFTAEPLYFKEVLHLSEWNIGLLMALSGLIITFVEMVLIYKLDGKQSIFFYIILGLVLNALSFMVFNLLFGFAGVALISIILMTFGEMLTMPFMNNYWISRSNDSNRGQYASLYTIAYSVAHILSSTIGTHIIARFGYASLWWFDGAICFACMLGFMALKRHSEKAQNNPANTP